MASGSVAVARVVPVGQVSTAGLVWRTRGELQLTVIVQARLAMQHERMMLLVEPRPLERRDAHRDDDPTKSLVAAADLVPFRPRVDVTMTGHACAPGGRPVRVGLVRLGLYRGSDMLLDKVVHVHGDRAAAGDAPEPFERMPLVYERAYGGAGFDANPVGVGADERLIAPNLVHPLHATEPACFSAISRYWRSRRQHISAEQRRDLDRPVAEVAADFDWRYFQGAPSDQQLDALGGDEWVVIDGIDATLLRLQTRLPKIQGVARLVGDGIGEEVALQADTLAIDADAKEVRVTWRGIVRVASRDELAALRLAAGVAHAGGSIDWQEAARGVYDEPTLLDSLPARALGDLGGDTLVAVERRDADLDVTAEDSGAGADAPPDAPSRPDGGADLGRTNLESTQIEAAPAWVRDGELEPTLRSREESQRAPMRYPRARLDDEVTDTNTSVQVAPHVPTDTVPSGVPAASGSELGRSAGRAELIDLADPTDHAPPVVPGPPPVPVVRPRQPPRPERALRPLVVRPPGAPSAFPPPLDRMAHANALRHAGATEEDIAAVLPEDETVPPR